ncbi:MAG TPA: DJ-1/PfpI family protein [Pyrinomonadaceae bacterium]|nr:DJ-1/PfpI family protein [Pyrinomonadaceae bacterium]
MKTSIIIFDKFTDIDLWLMWDLLNRVRIEGWEVKILGEKESHVSSTGIVTQTHGRIEEADWSDAVLFVSGFGTRERIADETWLDRFQLDPERQVIGSICSGSLILAKLGLLEGKTATTYPTTKTALEELGVEVVEKPLVAHGNVATAGGCLAQQYLVGWVIEKLADAEWRDVVIRSVQPVGEGLFFDDVEKLQKLYVPVSAKKAAV